MQKKQSTVKHKLSLLAGFIFLMCSNLSYSSSVGYFSECRDLQFYLGVDAQLRYSRGKGGYAQILNRSYGLFGVYAGLQLKPMWGLELGYLLSDHKSRSVRLQDPISPIDGLGFMQSGVRIVSHTRLKEYYADSVWTIPFASDLSMILVLGVLQTKPSVLLVHNSIPEYYSGQCRLILRGGVGVRWFLQDRRDGLALRTVLRGSHFRRSRIKLNPDPSHKIISKPFRNGFSLDIGLQWYF